MVRCGLFAAAIGAYGLRAEWDQRRSGYLALLAAISPMNWLGALVLGLLIGFVAGQV